MLAQVSILVQAFDDHAADAEHLRVAFRNAKLHAEMLRQRGAPCYGKLRNVKRFSGVRPRRRILKQRVAEHKRIYGSAKRFRVLCQYGYGLCNQGDGHGLKPGCGLRFNPHRAHLLVRAGTARKRRLNQLKERMIFGLLKTEHPASGRIQGFTVERFINYGLI